jgi:hypothetical protein
MELMLKTHQIQSIISLKITILSILEKVCNKINNEIRL